MLITPSKLRKNRLIRNVTLRCETLRKTHNNLFFTMTYDRDELAAIIRSKLTRANELLAYYTPRLVRPLKRRVVKVNQKFIYAEMKSKTNGRVKICKVDLPAYNGRNVMIDLSPELIESRKWLDENRSNKIAAERLHFMPIDLFNNLLEKYRDLVDYQKRYLIIPFAKFYEPALFNRLVMKKVFTLQEYIDDPTLMILADIRRGNFENLKGFDRIFLFNYNANILMSIDPNNITDQELQVINMRIRRLNSFNKSNNEQDLIDASDPEGYEVGQELDAEDKLENQKEEIINAVLTKVGNDIKIKLTDYSAANRDEQELIDEIRRGVENYIDSDKENASFNDLVDTVLADKKIRGTTARYLNVKLQTKDADAKTSKINDAEIDVIDSVLNTTDETQNDEVIEPVTLKTSKQIDPALQTSTTYNLDHEYNKKLAKKDLLNVLTSMGNNDYDPMMITKFKSEDTSDDYTSKDTYTISFQSPQDKSAVNFQIDIPKIIDDSYFYINGNTKSLNKQLTRLPLVKTKPDTVEFASNLNKITFTRGNGKMSRRNAKLFKLLNKFLDSSVIHIRNGNNANDNSAYQSYYEYTEIGRNIYSIDTPVYYALFNRKAMEETYSLLDIPSKLIGVRQTPFALKKLGDSYSALYYIDSQKDSNHVLEYDIAKKSATKVAEDLYTFLTETVLGLTTAEAAPPVSDGVYVYSSMRFLSKTYPIFVVCGVLEGMTNTLKRYDVEYQLTDTPIKSKDWASIQFKDCWFNYRDIIKNTLLLNVLYKLEPRNFNFRDFDTYQPYKEWFAHEFGNHIEIHARRMLRLNLSCLIDPITKEVLQFQKYPSDILGVLLTANTLLTTDVCPPPMDMSNFRLRGNEAIYGVLYEIIASEYIKYQNYKNKNAGVNAALHFNIPRNILIAKLMQMNNFNDISVLNPVLEALNTAAASAAGHRGINLGQAYTLKVRAYDESMYGITSANSTSFSDPGKVRTLVYNSNVTSPRGYFRPVDNPAQTDPTSILGVGDLLSYRNATAADPLRVAMQIGQTKHLIQTKKSHKMLLGSGAQHTLPYILSSQFIFKAKQNGLVKAHDDSTNCLLLEYDDGTIDAIDLNGNLVKNSSSGFYIEQRMAPQYAVGDRFEKGDILAYIPEFFTGKGKDCEYKPGYLAKVALASGDFCFEDATLVSEDLAEDLTTNVTMMKAVAIGKNAIINKLINKGDHVEAGDIWLSYINSYDDTDTMDAMNAMMAQMTAEEIDEFISKRYESKYTGRIADVKIFFNKEIDEYSESIQKLIKNYIASVQKRKDLLRSAGVTSIKIPPVTRTKDEKVAGTEFPADGGIIIQCFFEYADVLSPGSKITYTTALKGVLSNVVPTEEAPITEYRRDDHIQAVIASTGIMGRITLDIFSIMWGNAVLIEVGKQIKEIYNGERRE